MNFCIYCISAYCGDTKYVVGGTKDVVPNMLSHGYNLYSAVRSRRQKNLLSYFNGAEVFSVLFNL